MEKEQFEKFEEIVENVDWKIGALQDAFNDMMMQFGKYEDARADIMADALNELLKRGVVPGAKIRLVGDREYTVKKYTYNRITCEDFEGKEIGTDLDTMLAMHGKRWEVVK